MTLRDARTLRDQLRSYGYHSIVPLGFGPTGYFASIFGEGRIDFHDSSSARRHIAMRLRERRKSLREYEAMEARKLIRPARSPIELMIDRACGLA